MGKNWITRKKLWQHVDAGSGSREGWIYLWIVKVPIKFISENTRDVSGIQMNIPAQHICWKRIIIRTYRLYDSDNLGGTIQRDLS